MEHRQRAQQLYSETRCPEYGDQTEVKDSKHKLAQVKFLICQFLTFCSPVERYQFREYVNVVEASLAMPDFDASKAATAFENLELYMFLILACPWKPEYKELRKYAGFYQSKIDAHLKDAETIFSLIGYRDDKREGVLRLVRRINKDVILAVGFECLVASVECSILNDTYRKLNDRRITYAHIYKFRCKYDGGVDQLVFYVRKELNLNDDLKDSSAVISDSPHVESDHSFEDIQIGVRKRGSGCSKQDNATIPFADADEEYNLIDNSVRPEFQEGTFDEHMLASLRLVREEKEIKKPPPEVVKTTGSDEWSYVRDRLQNKYGQSYFDGPRGDTILKEEIPLVNDDIYREKPPLPHGVQLRNRIDKNEVEQLPGYEKVPPIPKASANFRDSGFISQQQPIYFPPTDSGYVGTSTRNGTTTLLTSPSEDVSLARPPVSYAVAEMAPTLPSHALRGRVSSQSLKLSSNQANRESEGFADRPVTKSLSLRSRKYPEEGHRTASFPRRTTDELSRSPVILKEKLSSNVTPQISENYSLKVVPQQLHYQSHTAPIAYRDPPRRSGSTTYMGRGRSLEMHDKEHWLCSHCTLMNYIRNNICEACGKSRILDDLSDKLRPIITSKTCDTCTYENPADSLDCEMCHNALSSELQTHI